MGVIYKLKQEVIDYILEEKKENPHFSCRQIAKIASDKFDVDISKSSVNTIIKSSQLSSSVGRRSIEKKDAGRKFQIPQERKEQFQKTMKQFGFEKEPVLLLEEAQKLPLLADPVAQEALLEFKEPAMILPVIEPPILLPQEDIKLAIVDQSDPDDFEKISILRQQRKDSFSKIYPGMGAVIFKTVLSLTDGLGFLSRLIKKYNNDNAIPDNLDEVLNIFMLLKSLGMKESELKDISGYLQTGVWTFDNNGAYFAQVLENDDLRKRFFQWTNNISIPETLLREYEKEKQNVFFNVYGFKIVLEDSTELFLDAILKSFYKTIEPLNLGAPFNHAMRLLSQYFIVNQKPIILDMENKGMDSSWENIAAVFEDVKGKRVQKIIALDEHLKEIFEFSMIPQKKRLFVVRLESSQVKHFVNNASASGKKMFYNELSDDVFYFSEAVFSMENNIDMKILIVENEKYEYLFSLVTNCLSWDAPEILSAYFMRWPQPFDADNKKRLLSPALFPSGNKTNITTFWDFTEDFRKISEFYLSNNFLSDLEKDKTGFLNEIFKLSGIFRQTDNLFQMLLCLPEDSLHQEFLKMLLRCLNQIFPIDVKGRRILIEIVPS